MIDTINTKYNVDITNGNKINTLTNAFCGIGCGIKKVTAIQLSDTIVIVYYVLPLIQLIQCKERMIAYN